MQNPSYRPAIPFFNDEPYKTVHEMSDNRNGVLKVIHTKPLSPTLALEIGEFFYQLRATLDAAIWKVHILSGGAEDALYATRIEFPICDTPKRFIEAAFHKIPTPDDFKLWITSIQPCFAEEFPNEPEVVAVLRNALLIIHDRARKDRHRRLNIIGAYLSSNTVLLEVTPPASVAYVETVSDADVFKDGAIYARFGLDNADSATTKIKAQGGFVVQVAIEEIPAAPDVDVAKQLGYLSAAVAIIIHKFERTFGR